MAFKNIRIFLMLGYTFTYGLISTLIFLTFLKLGATLLELIFYYAAMNLAAIILIYNVRSIEMRKNFTLTFIVMAILGLALANTTTKDTVILLGIWTGIAFYLFWIPINILFFLDVKNDEHAFASGKYYALFAVGRAIVPLFAGFLAYEWTAKSVYAISAFLFSLLLLVALQVKPQKIRYNIRKGISEMRSISFLILLEGFRTNMYYMAIPLFTLVFIQTELKLGGFLSILGLAGTIASLLLTKLSDASKNRTSFIYPISITLALTTMALFFARDILSWTIISSLIYFFNTLVMPFEVTVLIDKVEDKKSLMATREFLLAIGRFSGAVVVALVYFITNSFYASFLIIGAVYLLYPLIVHTKGFYK